MKILVRAALAAALILPLAPTFASAAPLDRAKVVLPSAISVDLAANTVTLPLYRGSVHGNPVWYIKTDVSNAAVAKREGLLYAPLLASSASAAQHATGASNAFAFAGGVDFTPQRVLTTAADGSVTAAKPGSVGDDAYSPFVHAAANGAIYNAPIVASGAHPSDVATHNDTLDRVVAIDTRDTAHASVTLVLARGFTNGQPIAYISTDASADGPAAIERSTYVPRLAKAAAAAIAIDVLFNGRTDGESQGIAAAGLHGSLGAEATVQNAAEIGSPLNVQATFPAPNFAASGYSPLWHVAPAVWTAAALSGGKAHRLRSSADFAAAASANLITAPDGKPFGPAPIFVNCPVVGFEAARP
ncbi:hypothetical protein WPS_05160 [Vulcanimicrobium alpinum]|uniref:DUF7482 domain-containing protein n=1 Tax=Vulcanimicrobium alpinum TaxID=3016050 RepID=A0AAN1XT25_UNVUL|nr:hypothetical protein [Vulcanimicrobium alpinum]BDE05240.1 hypothetical protein WPS_05160 [Vulcanimicrobium alpinum]